MIIKNASTHNRLGQTVTIYETNIIILRKQIIPSCYDLLAKLHIIKNEKTRAQAKHPPRNSTHQPT